RRQLVLLGQLDEQPHDLARRLGVEAGRGLVDEQDVGVLQEGAGDADALALPAGELVGALVELVGDPDALEELVGAADGARRSAGRMSGPGRGPRALPPGWRCPPESWSARLSGWSALPPRSRSS